MTHLPEARRQLIALRNKHGHASPIGSRCSTAVEIMQNLEKPEFAWRILSLRYSLATTLAEIHSRQRGIKLQARREVA